VSITEGELNKIFTGPYARLEGATNLVLGCEGNSEGAYVKMPLKIYLQSFNRNYAYQGRMPNK
jgi:hypothetical protein